jgi:hypothetical protein
MRKPKVLLPHPHDQHPTARCYVVETGELGGPATWAELAMSEAGRNAGGSGAFKSYGDTGHHIAAKDVR